MLSVKPAQKYRQAVLQIDGERTIHIANQVARNGKATRAHEREALRRGWVMWKMVVDGKEKETTFAQSSKSFPNLVVW